MNRYLIFYDADTSSEQLGNEMRRLKTVFPLEVHFQVNDNMLMVKSIYPLGKFIDATGFSDTGAMNGFVIQIYNINGWYKTELWDWYYSKD